MDLKNARVAVLGVEWEWLSGGDAFTACALVGEDEA